MIWKRTRHSHRGKQDSTQKATKLADLEMLQWSAAVGEIDLFYLDESGFCLWMPAQYSYFFIGEQKRIEQTHRRGRRISMLGLLQPFVSFVYGLVVGSFDADRYISLMDEQARQAKQQFEPTGRFGSLFKTIAQFIPANKSRQNGQSGKLVDSTCSSYQNTVPR